MPTFLNRSDYQRFLFTLNYYRFHNPNLRLSHGLRLPIDQGRKILDELEEHNTKIVEIVCFSLMPNHFHILVKQLTENGISTYLRKIANSYTKYFNTKHERVGPLFQGPFKAVLIEDDYQLIHVSRYIHLNALVSSIVSDKDFISYPWSSLSDYAGKNRKFINPKIVLDQFVSKKDYMKFVLDHADYAKDIEKIKHLTFE
ncbi:MAG: transposase [bacterium]|nr:transposase [bacterium]